MNYHCYCLSIPISPDYSASSECNHLNTAHSEY